jgi:hypothetical protein
VSISVYQRVKRIFVIAALIFLVWTNTPAQTEVEKLSKNTDLLRQLYSEGLIALNELEKSEQELAAAKVRAEETKKAQELASKAQELAKTKPLIKRTSMPLSNGSAVMRSNGGNWSIGNLSMIQQFFSTTFGRPLPTSTIGQSATHNRMGWDHRHAVDVGLHPDSSEGRALIAYLQNAGIPFLAFRGAVPGVSTGPHIHIGNPSRRI